MGFYERAADGEKYLYYAHKTPDSEGVRIDGPLHFHRSCELLFVRKGVQKIAVNGAIFEISEGGGLFLQPFIPHRYYRCYGVEVSVLVVSEWYLKVFTEVYGGVNLPLHLDNSQLNEKIVAHMSLFENSGITDDLAAFLVVNNIFYNLKSGYGLSGSRLGKTDDAVVKILGYIEEHILEDFSMQTIADELGYSKHYCSKIFNSAIGEGFRSYLNGLRVRRVHEELLKNPEANVLQTAFGCGFCSSATFYRAYLKEYGTKPSKAVSDTAGNDFIN